MVTKRVLFVCTGNTCRSPMAEAIFRRATRDRQDYQVKSAGVSASNGTPCSLDTRNVCADLELEIEDFTSQVVTEELLEEATHVFTMTKGHLAALEEGYPQFSAKYYLVCEFVEIEGKGFGADVPDPIGMGPAAYQDTCRVLEKAIPAIIAYLDQTA